VKASRGVSLTVASILLVAATATAAAAAGGSAPRDGYYAPLGVNTTSAIVFLSVIDNGKQVADKANSSAGNSAPGLTCDKDPAEQAEGLNPSAAFVRVYLPPGLKLRISAGRKFSYSGPAYLPSSEVPAGVTQPAGTIRITGRFVPASAVKGKESDDFVVAFSGTASATLCPAAPATFHDIWSKSTNI
jgi:hypothetical protein